MTDSLSGFWSGWVISLTLVSVIVLVWVVYSIYFSSRRDSAVKRPVWDSTLEEGHHAPPMWWFWLILGLLVFSVIYLILYPGLGNYKGSLQWTQHVRHESSHQIFDQTFSELRDSIAQTPITDLQKNQTLMKSAQGIFMRNCAACHGKNGTGQAFAFPSLMDSDWQWGESDEQIELSIRNGRQGVMPGWSDILSKEQIKELADYVINFRTNEIKGIRESHQGHGDYGQYCAVCHAQDGAGILAMGAPDIGDLTWIYGKAPEQVIYSIAQGRQGVMTAFEGRLDDVQIRLLAAWLIKESRN